MKSIQSADTMTATVSHVSMENVFLDSFRAFGKMFVAGFRKVRRLSWRFLKRLLDFFLSATWLILLAPAFLIVAVLIKLDDGGPVFFRQVRTGRKGNNFKIVKFRTCRVDNDVLDKNGEDAYTKIGKLLRRTSIDELPQLWNIMRGQMSFVGPRPWITEYWDNMTDEQRLRVSVTPGLTGLAQVKGRNSLSVFDKINYDLEYVKNYGVRQDLKVLFLTVVSMLSKDAEPGVNAGKSGIHSELDQLRRQQR